MADEIVDCVDGKEMISDLEKRCSGEVDVFCVLETWVMKQVGWWQNEY